MTGETEKPKGWDEAAAGPGAILLADGIFDGQHIRTDAALLIANGRVAKVGVPHAPDRPFWRMSGLVCPGFVDLQVNGGGGVLFNNRPTAEGLVAIARAHRSTGTAAFLPTLITDAPEIMERAARAILEVIGQEGIVGLHLEGPHLSEARRGTHETRFIRPLDDQTLAIVARLRAREVPLMLTIAPEAVVAGQIADLVGQGVVVALGHSAATFEQVQAALAEGAQTFTHLFNAMSQMQVRAPGMVGAAIRSTAYASMICDGVHVAPEMLSIAMRARPRDDRMIIVTDAMPTVAGPPHYELYGRTIRLQDGRLVNEDGALAGAHVTMLQSVKYAIEVLDQTAEQALRMAVTHPAELMGLNDLVQLEDRSTKDVLLIADNWMTAEFLG